jgi:uncharacterized RDD family membrane protein YckC
MSTDPGPGRAGVVTRLLAAAADVVVVVLLTALTYLAIAGARFVWWPIAFTWPRPTTAVVVLVAGLIATVYLTVAWATTGCTYGGGLLGVQVLGRWGGRLGWARASVRALACVLFPVGLLWCAISPTRRSAQDLVLGSIVIYDGQREGGVRVAAGSSDPGREPRP